MTKKMTAKIDRYEISKGEKLEVYPDRLSNTAYFAKKANGEIIYLSVDEVRYIFGKLPED